MLTCGNQRSCAPCRVRYLVVRRGNSHASRSTIKTSLATHVLKRLASGVLLCFYFGVSVAPKTRHRASTSMYSLAFCVRFLLPERHQRKPAVQAAAVMLTTPPRRRPITGKPATSTSNIRRAILRTPPSPASQRPAARADPAQPAVRTMSSYRGMDASL